MINMDKFLNPKIGLRSVRNWLIRGHISRFIKDKSECLTGRLLDVGCGCSPYYSLLTSVEEYVGMDIEDSSAYEKTHTHVLFDGITFPFQNSEFESVLLTEVLEHTAEPKKCIQEIYRVLKPGGRLLLTSPFVWPIHEKPYDFQRFTHYGLMQLLTQAGFTDIQIQAHGGWHTCMAQMFGCYCVQAFSMGNFWRRLRIILFFPLLFIIQKLLPLLDRKRKNEISDWTLGYGVMAQKPEDCC